MPFDYSGHRKKNHQMHHDEKWLVSYSDLMTLLFGFFVLMYSIAKENTGNSTEKLLAISSSLNGETKKVSQNRKITSEELGKIEKELNILKIKTSDMEKEKNNSADEIKVLKSKVAFFDKTEEENKKLKQIINDLEAKNNVIGEDGKPIERMKELSQKLEDMNKELKKSEQDLFRLKKTNEELKTKNYMLIFSKWETEKHDIDLTVKNPLGKLFNFKNRKYEGMSGEFVLDSRYGPGAEIWTSNQVIPGEYEVKVTLYNQYGNEQDAVVNTTIIIGLEKIIFPEVKLSLGKNQTVVYKVKVSELGKMEVLL